MTPSPTSDVVSTLRPSSTAAAADGASQDPRRYDAAFARLEEILRGRYAALGAREDIRGEIAAMPPTGRLVPHGDVVRTLDALIAAGLSNIAFEGTAPPLFQAEGGVLTGIGR